MSEIQKHIESCRSEDPLAQTMEVCGNENDLQAALQPLLAETMQGYVPVETTAPTSPIAELPNVLISIIRRVATKPLTMFGDRPAKQSLLGTLLDTWNAIRQRLSGNPSAGIPDRRAEMTSHSLPTALALLNDRKITNGFSTTDGIPDGMSLARLLCDTSAANSVTEIVDDNEWGEYLRDAQSDITSKFPNLNKLTFGARVIRINSKYIILFNKNLSYLYFPNLEEFYGVMTTTGFNGSITNSSAITKLEMPELKRIDVQYSELGPISRQSAVQIAKGCTSLREVLMPSLTYMPPNLMTSYENYMFTSCPNIEKMVLGKLTALNPWITQYALNTPMEKLIHIEFGEGTAISLNLAYWNPSVALDASRTDLIEQGSTAENNLQQFLQNFRDYIAKRIANRTGLSKLTLTLSANVFSAVFTNESGSTEEIVARNAIRDEIRGEITDRNWKVTDSTNNFNN